MAALIGASRHHEQKIGKPVEIGREAPVHRLDFGQRHHPAFGAPHHGARQMEPRRRRRAARQHEGIERRQGFVERIDLGLQPRHLAGLDAQLSVAGVRAWRRNVGAQIEQVVLDARQNLFESGIAGRRGRMDGGKADDRAGLVDAALGLDSRRPPRPPRGPPYGNSPIPGLTETRFAYR